MTRWWNDAQEAVAKLELVDGANPAAGVGVAVLGFHSIAKDALTPLAHTTLHDQESLVRAYDGADFTPVMEAVHSAMCGAMEHEAAARYAQMVVNDWVNTSKESTVRLATTLVNKGQPWPRAIARASEVAGVPLRHLSRYATSAASPGLDAISVADMADRTLFTYAAHRAAMESDMVSKARARTRHQAQTQAAEQWDESEVVRDDRGRFAVEAASQAAIDELKAKREARRRRRERQARTQTAPAPVSRVATREASRGVATREVSRGAPTRVRSTGAAGGSSRPSEDAPTKTSSAHVPGTLDQYGNPISPGQVSPISAGKLNLVNERLYVLQDSRYGDPKSSGMWWHAYRGRDIDTVIDEAIKLGEIEKDLVVLEFDPGQLLVRGHFDPDTDDNPIKTLKDTQSFYVMMPFTLGRDLPVVDVEVLARPGTNDIGYSVTDPYEPKRNAHKTDEVIATTTWIDSGVPKGRIEKVPVHYKHARMYLVDDIDSMDSVNPMAYDFGKARARTRTQIEHAEQWDESEVVRDARGRFAVEAQSAMDVELKAKRAARKRRREREAQSAAAPAQQAPTREASRGVATREIGRGAPVRTLSATGRTQVRTAPPAVAVATPQTRTAAPPRALAAFAGDNIDRDTRSVMFRRGVIETQGLNVWRDLRAGGDVSFPQALINSRQRLKEGAERDGYSIGHLSMAYPGAAREDAVVLEAIYAFTNATFESSQRLNASPTGLSTSFQWNTADSIDDDAANVMLTGQRLARYVTTPIPGGPDTTSVTMMVTRGDGSPEISTVVVPEDAAGLYEPQLMLLADPQAMQIISDLYFMTTPLLNQIGDMSHSEDFKRGQRLLAEYGAERGVPMEYHDRSNQLDIVLAYLADHPLFLERVPDMVKEAAAYEAMTTAGSGAVRLDGIDIVRVSSKEPL